MKGQFITGYLLPALLLILALIAMAVLLLIYGVAESSPAPYLITGGTLLAIVLLAFIILRAREDESQRLKIAVQLENFSEKYKALMETSTDGTLLVVGQDILFANFVLMAMSGYTMREIQSMKPMDLLEVKGGGLEALLSGQGEMGRTLNTEAFIRCKRRVMREVLLAVSAIRLDKAEGMIIVVKDISGRERLEKESSAMMNELQSCLLQMNLPVSSIVRKHIFCDMDISVLDAAKMMSRKNQDAIIVMKDNSRALGIVTDKDMRDRVLANGCDPRGPVSEIMSSPIARISEQSLLYEAILLVREKGISHLAVEDKNGHITGIFDTNDLLDVQRNSISYLVKEIEAAESVDSLKRIHDKIPVLIRILLESGSRIKNITYMISTVTDAITHRLIEFAIEEMGEPPVQFAFMAMGSEGRREQTLVTDQDNAIIFEDVPNDRFTEVNRYFLYFGKKINLWLDRVGYRYCQGEVMAGNPQWCQPLSRWKDYFTDWVNAKSEEGLLGLAVFFDFRIVFGMEQYGEALRKHIHRTASGKSHFFQLLAKEAAAYDIPDKLTAVFDVKNALSPLVDFIRVYSIHNQVTETNSMLRLDRLLRYNIIGQSDFHEIETVYNQLMEIRFRSHVHEILNNEAPDNLIKQEELTAVERTLVTKSFSEISRYQLRIVEDFS